MNEAKVVSEVKGPVVDLVKEIKPKLTVEDLPIHSHCMRPNCRRPMPVDETTRDGVCVPCKTPKEE